MNQQASPELGAVLTRTSPPEDMPTCGPRAPLAQATGPCPARGNQLPHGLPCTEMTGILLHRRTPCTAYWVCLSGPQCPRPLWCVCGVSHIYGVHRASSRLSRWKVLNCGTGQNSSGCQGPEIQAGTCGCVLREGLARGGCHAPRGPRGGTGPAPSLPSSAPLWGSTSSFISSFISSSMITFPVREMTDTYRGPTLVVAQAAQSLPEKRPFLNKSSPTRWARHHMPVTLTFP